MVAVARLAIVRKGRSGKVVRIPGGVPQRGEVEDVVEGCMEAVGRRRSFAGGDGMAENSGRGQRGRSAA